MAPIPPELPAALEGVRVLDLSRVLAAPWCTQTLADLGADVIKVERPRSEGHPGGDDTRGWGPPFLKDHVGHETAEAAYYLGCNRNKRSVTVDLAQPDGQALIRRLAATCDVLVENFKVGDMARYGLDAASLLALQPRLVYCSITGFGQTGPYRERAGYDYAVQGLGGLMSVTGERDDRPGGGPQKVGVAVADLFTGLYATVAIQAALRHRDATGRGQVIDMALLDTQVAMLANLGANYLVTGVAPRRAGNAHQNIVPYQVFEAAKVPCGAINDLAEVFADPQVRAREMAVPVPHPLTDSLRLVASPMKLSATPVQVRRAPPLLGQHTDEVLGELGLDESERARLRERGVI